MYSSGPVNFPIPIPPPNFCAPAIQGNIPFQQSFAPPFYPPAAPAYNYYNNAPPLFSQPPPGYAANGAHMGPSTNNPVPSYQPVHLANVCSPSFNGFQAPNVSTVCNQFTRPPPAIPNMNDVQKNPPNRFANRGNNRRVLDAKNSPYFCEACDRGFMSLGKFTQHKSEHVTCGKEGCTFSAHSKIVEKHFLMQHRSGLFSRIVKGNSPEEIQKWISERKKHFPTKEKIEVKQAQREEMAKRGERYAERKRKFNQRNSNFKSGLNNRYDKSTQNRNGQFKSRAFGHRRNSFRNGTDNSNRSENKRKDIAINEDDDCSLRNLPPFRGTVFYQNMENNSRNEFEERLISDDDNFSILSADDDDDITVIDYDRAVINEKVISELEKSNEITRLQDDSEKDCLDKYFRNCDTVDQNDEETDNRDAVTDINGLKRETTNSLVDPLVSRSNEFDRPICDKTVSKTVSSLALIQCYDSDGSDDEDNMSVPNNCKTNPFLSNKIESKSNCSTENDELDENTSKCISVVRNNVESNSSSLDKITVEKVNDSSDDGEPEEYSSKSVLFENNHPQSSSPVKTFETHGSNHDGPTVCLSECTVASENDISTINKEDETKGLESKRRRRKRQRNNKDETECGEESDKKPENQLPPVLRARKRYKPPTLLEKLLSNEIKHERNVILQCIRYVVNNDFFKVGDSVSA